MADRAAQYTDHREYIEPGIDELAGLSRTNPLLAFALGIFMFTFIILSLVAVLMLAKTRLVSTGEVTILINGDPDKYEEALRREIYSKVTF